MGELNFKIWQWIFSLFHHTTDNVCIIAIVIAGFFGFLFGVCSRKNSCPVFFSIPVFMSASHALTHLPSTHGLLKTALSTTANIIIRSKESFDGFSKASGVTTRKLITVAKYLFYENDSSKFRNVSPSMVYEHFFKVKDKILKFFFIDNAAERSIWLIVAAILIAVIITTSLRRKSFFIFAVIAFIVSCQNAATMLFYISFIIACFSASKWRNKHIISGDKSSSVTR